MNSVRIEGEVQKIYKKCENIELWAIKCLPTLWMFNGETVKQILHDEFNMTNVWVKISVKARRTTERTSALWWYETAHRITRLVPQSRII